MSNLDWLAEQILAVYAEGGATADPAYLAGKRHDFEGLDRLALMRKLSNLDAERREAFAARIGVQTSDLDAFLRVLRQL